MGPNLMDEIDHLFDQIDDFIEFPPDSECDGNLVSLDSCKDIPSMWSEPLHPGGGSSSSSHDNPASDLDLSTEFCVPYEDVVQLEWLSTFVEDSYSGGGLTIGKENEHWRSHIQTSSPVSVLESSSSSSSCSGEKIPAHRGPQRARSKRPRPSTFNPRPPLQPFIDPPQHLFIAPVLSSESSENFGESPPLKKKIKKPESKKTKKIRTTSEEEDHHHQSPPPVRKCLHCEITKTPQWRAGPLGPKTLCNACGVRYKSGRLFPEYRPAASPTFVPSIHSNSHKKVLEMRNSTVTADPEPVSNP